MCGVVTGCSRSWTLLPICAARRRQNRAAVGFSFWKPISQWPGCRRMVASAAARPTPGPPLAQVIGIAAEAGLVARRLYRPGSSPRPLVVYLHGGAWVGGDLDSHDRTCRRLAAAADVGVLAVDFRKPPAHPWPAAVDDAVAAWRWATAQRAVLGAKGRSVGIRRQQRRHARRARVPARARRGRVGASRPAARLPEHRPHFAQPSVAEFGTGFGLEVADLRRHAAEWVPDPAVRASGAASPLLAERLDDLPPALVVTAELDPLRDEGDAYAERLRTEGVHVDHRREPGMLHGFVQNVDLWSPAAAAAAERAFAAVGRIMRRRVPQG